MTDDFGTRQALTGMVWGVRASFFGYVQRMPGTRIQTGYGAGRIPTGEFFFSLEDDSSFDRNALTGVLKFQGLVQVTAHGGMLNVQLINPWLTVADEGAVLSVIDRRQPAESDARVDLVTVSLPTPTSDGETLMWAEAGTALTAAALPIFNEQYPAGDAFDPVTVRILY